MKKLIESLAGFTLLGFLAASVVLFGMASAPVPKMADHPDDDECTEEVAEEHPDSDCAEERNGSKDDIIRLSPTPKPTPTPKKPKPKVADDESPCGPYIPDRVCEGEEVMTLGEFVDLFPDADEDDYASYWHDPAGWLQEDNITTQDKPLR